MSSHEIYDNRTFGERTSDNISEARFIFNSNCYSCCLADSRLLELYNCPCRFDGCLDFAELYSRDTMGCLPIHYAQCISELHCRLHGANHYDESKSLRRSGSHSRVLATREGRPGEIGTCENSICAFFSERVNSLDSTDAHAATRGRHENSNPVPGTRIFLTLALVLAPKFSCCCVIWPDRNSKAL